MKSWLRTFNIFLLAGAVLAGGCSSHHLSMHKDYATLSVFLEGRPADSLPVEVGWNKTTMYIEASPVLTENDLAKAILVDYPDGTYEIQLTLNPHGKQVLEMQTISKRGRHLVFFAKFPPKGSTQEPTVAAPAAAGTPPAAPPRISAWLAAILIPPNGFSSGMLRFKPDASHTEAERIVLGLNNMSKAEE